MNKTNYTNKNIYTNPPLHESEAETSFGVGCFGIKSGLSKEALAIPQSPFNPNYDHIESGQMITDGPLRTNPVTGQKEKRLSFRYCYEGQTKNGKPHGEGNYTDKNGNTFSGNWKDGVLENGKWTDRQGHVTSRVSWKDGQFKGSGELKHRLGHRYIGDWVNGSPEGIGKLLYDNGSQYQGEFNDGSPHGQGLFKNEKGISKEGLWEKGHFLSGVRMDKEGNKWEGNWTAKSITDSKGNLREYYELKHGIWTSAKGTHHYEGEFYDYCAQGKGKAFCDSMGSYKEGTWRGGEIIEGTCRYNDKSIFSGTFKNSQRHNGHYTSANQDSVYIGSFNNKLFETTTQMASWKSYSGRGESYQGEFKNGLFHGQGTLSGTIGDINHTYQGEFKDGLFHGKGVMTYSDGMRVEGEWHYGKMKLVNYKYVPERVGETKLTPKEFYQKYPNLYPNGVEKPPFYQKQYDIVGNYCEGIFINNKLRHGMMISADNNEKYVGEFKDGKLDGFGIIDRSDGVSIEGNWKNGIFVGGKSRIYNSKGQCLTGEDVKFYDKGGPEMFKAKEIHLDEGLNKATYTM